MRKREIQIEDYWFGTSSTQYLKQTEFGTNRKKPVMV